MELGGHGAKDSKSNSVPASEALRETLLMSSRLRVYSPSFLSPVLAFPQAYIHALAQCYVHNDACKQN